MLFCFVVVCSVAGWLADTWKSGTPFRSGEVLQWGMSQFLCSVFGSKVKQKEKN